MYVEAMKGVATFLFRNLYPKDWFLLGSFLMDHTVPSAKKRAIWYVIYLNKSNLIDKFYFSLVMLLNIMNDPVNVQYLDHCDMCTHKQNRGEKSISFQSMSFSCIEQELQVPII